MRTQIQSFCEAGLSLVAIPPIDGKPVKAPISPGWNRPRTANNPKGFSNNAADFACCNDFNFGLYHAASNTLALDLDDLELARKVFIDAADTHLPDWLTDTHRLEIKSPKENRAKLFFKLPHGFTDAKLHQLKFNGTVIFELRCGNCQDVIYGRHPEGGNYELIGNPAEIPEIPSVLLDMLKHWDDWKPCLESALGIEQKPPKIATHKPQQCEQLPGRRDPIQEFNQANSARDVLIRNGYKSVQKDRFIRPGSESKAPGVVILRNCADGIERIFSHGGDVLNDGYAHDAFDCFRLLEHGGDWTAALNWNPEISKQNQQLFRQQQAKTAHQKPPKTESTHGQANTNSSTFNETLDTEHNYCTVDMLRHVDDDHLLKRLSQQVAAETHLPVNTVFLMGMTVYSSMAARKYAVVYPNGMKLPIGLYSVVEQPSGTGKSWCLSTFQKPFHKNQKASLDAVIKKIKRFEKKQEAGEKPTDADMDDYSEMLEMQKLLNIGLFVSNATPEGLETTLTHTSGFFSAISSEQGLFDTLLGCSYKSEKSSNNNDVVLNGFDGGHVNSIRVGRPGYHGHVVGGVACFAQQGSSRHC